MICRILLHFFAVIRLIGIGENDYQREALIRLTGASEGNHPQNYLRNYGFVRPDENYLNECTWHGITCHCGNIQMIMLAEVRAPRPWSLSWLPKTLVRIDTHLVSMRTHFPARHLPPTLQHCSLKECELTGKNLNLKTLPTDLHLLDLSLNYLTGTVFIAHLPPNMTALGLHLNRLSRVVGVREGLPDETEVTVTCRMQYRQRGKELKIVHRDVEWM